MAEGADALSGMFAGRYAIDAEVGRGATAIVYRAVDTQTHERVALKVLRQEVFEAAGSQRFLKEIAHHTRISHPGVLHVLDSGTVDGVLYLVLPYMDEGTLRSRLDREKQLPFTDAIRIAEEVASALAGAHDAGVVHRDVKPENILFSGGRAHLGDLGIARALERAVGETTTSTGIVRGTPLYMSPEQASGDSHYDGRSDIYSLGCVLYEMIAGVPAFIGPSAQSVIAQRLTHEPRSVAQYRDRTPALLDAAINRALAVSPADRFQTAREFADALARAAEDARSPHAPTVQWAAARRRRRVLVGIGLAFTAATALVVTSLRSRTAETGRIPDGDPRRVAVLYFSDLTPDSLPVHVVDGITEDLIDRLGSVRALHVTSPNGVRLYRTGTASPDSIARVLKVGTIVSGSVARSGDRLRVTVRFVDAATARQVDSRTLEEPWAELFGLQDRLAEQVQFWLRQQLGNVIALRENRAASRSVEAWELAQAASRETRRGIQTMMGRGDTTAVLAFLRADSLYERAMTLDAQWTLPAVRRAELALYSLGLRSPRPPPEVDSATYAGLSRDERRVVWARRAAAIANEVLRRHPHDVGARSVRGQATASLAVPGMASSDSMLADAERDLAASIAERPDMASSWAAMAEVQLRRGSFVEAAESARRAFDADAYFELRRVVDVAFTAALFAEQFDDARTWCRLGLTHYAGDPRFTECELRLLGVTGSSRHAADSAWRLIRDIEARDSLRLLEVTWGFRRLMAAAILARGAQGDSARRVMMAVERHQPEAARRSSELAACYVLTLLGDHAAAVERLAALMQATPAPRLPLPRLPWFRALRGDRRFDALLARRI